LRFDPALGLKSTLETFKTTEIPLASELKDEYKPDMKTAKQAFTKTIISTLCALIAFATNSVLGRMALGEKIIDAASFTAVRLMSGALVLFLLLILNGHQRRSPASKDDWFTTCMLFLYALTFSFAYLKLETGTGALILFGAVQITMILISLFSGKRLHIVEWIGLLMSFLGFFYLVLPGVTAPSFTGFFLMTTAGIAWGVYTLKGRGSAHPLSDTAYHFLRTIPLVLVLVAFTFQNAQISLEGIWLACLSGGITSGMGYTIWYTALRGLSITQAAVVQLSVPVIAALGGAIFVSEEISFRLVVSSLFILGGILVVILGQFYWRERQFEDNRLH